MSETLWVLLPSEIFITSFCITYLTLILHVANFSDICGKITKDLFRKECLIGARTFSTTTHNVTTLKALRHHDGPNYVVFTVIPNLN